MVSFFSLTLPMRGDSTVLDDQLVSVGCGGADVGLGVELIPGPQPGGHGVVLRAGYIDAPDLLQRRLEPFFDLRLGFAQHVLDNPLPGLGIVSGGISPLPPAVLPLADISFPVGSFLCHGDRLLCSNTTYHTFSWIATPNGHSYQTVINLPKRRSLCQRRITFRPGRKPFFLFYSGAEFEWAIPKEASLRTGFWCGDWASVNPSADPARDHRPCGPWRSFFAAPWPGSSGRCVDGARWRL